MARTHALRLALPAALVVVFGSAVPAASSSFDPGVGVVPQGTQSDKTYAASFAKYGVSNVSATTQVLSCYMPEASAAAFNDGPNDGYSGETACPTSKPPTGEDPGP